MGKRDDETSVADLSKIRPASETDRDKAYLIVLSGSNVGQMIKVPQDEIVVGRSVKAGLQFTDDGVSRSHCKLRMSGDTLIVEDLGSRNGTFCNGERISVKELVDGDKIQLGNTTILKFTHHDRLDESFQQQMYDSALRDSLTGCYNKRYFLERLQDELKFAIRHRSSLSLMIFDLDHFKRVNDTYGHVVGDQVLAEFATRVHQVIRSEDVFARYGGEEFAIISRGISRDDTMQFADRIRGDIEELEIIVEDRRVPVTCSIGIATFPEDRAENVTNFIAAADTALYKAKSGGRNRVETTPIG